MGVIPNSWILIGAGVLLLGSNAMTGCAVRKHYVAVYEAEKASAKNDALQAKIEADRKTLDLEKATEAKISELEKKHAADLQVADAGRDAFERKLNLRLRASEDRTRQCEAARKAEDSASPEIPDNDGRRVGSVDPGAVSRLRDAGLNILRDLRLCKAWAQTVGR